MDEGYHKPDRAEKMAFTQEVGLKSLYGDLQDLEKQVNQNLKLTILNWYIIYEIGVTGAAATMVLTQDENND